MALLKSKRKHSANTAEEQYEEYLNMMENDYVFRSGIINPTLGDDYVNKKWEELTIKLNSLGNGPSLSPEIWKKRFNDWKNATRSKHRKIQEHKFKTGGGPETDIKLTAIEERGINVWGRVTVSGSCKILATGGLPQKKTVTEENAPAKYNAFEKQSITISDENVLAHPVRIEVIDTLAVDQNASSSPIDIHLGNQFTNFAEHEYFQSQETFIRENTHSQKIPENIHKNTHAKKFPMKPNTRHQRQRQKKPLSEVAESLMRVYTDSVNFNKELNINLKRVADLYEKSEEKKIKLETKKLEFEIAKYKFEHNDFVFEDD